MSTHIVWPWIQILALLEIHVNPANILLCCGLADNAPGENEGEQKARGRDHLQCLLLPDGRSGKCPQVWNTLLLSTRSTSQLKKRKERWFVVMKHHCCLVLHLIWQPVVDMTVVLSSILDSLSGTSCTWTTLPKTMHSELHHRQRQVPVCLWPVCATTMD